MGRGKKQFIDLFAGCGGLSLGLMKAGWEGIFAIESNKDAFKTLKTNLIEKSLYNHENPRFSWPNWLDVSPHEIKEFLKNYKGDLKNLEGVDLVVGGIPCQGFSYAGKRRKTDKRNELYKYFIEFVGIVKPNIVLIENVKGIDKPEGINTKRQKSARGRPRKSYLEKISQSLKKIGYEVTWDVLNSSNYGVPQNRKRVFIWGVQRDNITEERVKRLKTMVDESKECFLRQRNLPINQQLTVYDAISDLETKGKKIIDCNDEDSPEGFKEIEYVMPLTPYQSLMREGLENGLSPNSLRLTKHKMETIKRFEKILRDCEKGKCLSIEKRKKFGLKKHTLIPLSPIKPSPTVTTLPDDFIHYSEPRINTVRENARIQSFPDWFAFKGKFTTGGKLRPLECPRYTQVGNAVPPLLAEIIGKVLLGL